jgi:hypothetical protein
LEKAAGIATHHGAWRLRDLKQLLDQPAHVTQLDFLETHPVIRSLEVYRLLAREEFHPNNVSVTRGTSRIGAIVCRV